MENVITLGKLLSLWFCFLLHSILFLKTQTSYRTYKIISSKELARPVMGTIFLVIHYSCLRKAKRWENFTTWWFHNSWIGVATVCCLSHRLLVYVRLVILVGGMGLAISTLAWVGCVGVVGCGWAIWPYYFFI